jgi:two-component system CheB/CheR fusion protein
MNDQQRERSDEVDRLNLFLEGILGNLGVGVVVLDQEQAVQVWNSAATDLWGLRPDEVVGRRLQSLDIGLPVEQVRDAVEDVLTRDGGGPRSLTLPALTRRGKQFDCVVRVLPLLDRTSAPYGALVLMSSPAGSAVSVAAGDEH